MCKSSATDRDPRKSSGHRAPQETTEGNPFLELRQYAHARLSSLCDSLLGPLPTAKSPSESQGPQELSKESSQLGQQLSGHIDELHQENRALLQSIEQLRDGQSRRAEMAEGGFPPSRDPSQGQSPYDRLRHPTCSRERARDDMQENDFLFAIYKDHAREQFFGDDDFGFWARRPHFLTGQLISSPWILPYLIYDVYSPLYLHQSDQFSRAPHRTRTPNWSAAFEDLLLTSHGQNLPPRDEYANPQHAATHHHPSTLPDNIDEYSNGFPPATALQAIPRSSTSPDADEPSTELDLYTRFLSSSTSHPPLRQEVHRSLSEDARSEGVLSTLTTTERTIDADGRVTTKVVLKKRFADGREEVGETVHQSHTGQAVPSARLEGPGRDLSAVGKKKTAWREKEKKAKNERRGGWFWSS